MSKQQSTPFSGVSSMRDILYPDHAPSDPNPMKRAQNAMARHLLPKRFYQEATVGAASGGHALLLDGKMAKTPGRNGLVLPTPAAAALIASEWNAAVDVINPARMHATRMANTAIDSLGGRIVEVQADVAGYAASDLVCYRASDPEGLVMSQNQHWNPVVQWAEESLKTRFVLAEGIIHHPQSDAALNSVKARVATIDQPVALACLHVITTISGSCLIALMFAAGAVPGDDAWSASIVDEDWNASLWGRDEEAETRLAHRKQEFLAACGLLRAVMA
jgi:chaperone required for assembly of F1-ATPase